MIINNNRITTVWELIGYFLYSKHHCELSLSLSLWHSLKQGLLLKRRLALNLRTSCLSLLKAGIISSTLNKTKQINKNNKVSSCCSCHSELLGSSYTPASAYAAGTIGAGHCGLLIISFYSCGNSVAHYYPCPTDILTGCFVLFCLR